MPANQDASAIDPPSVLLRAERLQRRFNQEFAVKDVSLTLKKGEVLGLLGLNGAGKSTTLSMLSGILAPSKGWVRINNLDIAQYPNDAKSQLGYLPDNPPLYPEQRVGEYLSYAAALRGIHKNAIPAAIDRAIELCHLGDVKNRIIGNLSKGFRQRTGLAQALIHKPSLLILDEPSSGLDPVQMIQMRELIRTLSSECGVILSSHILPEVTAVCDRVAIIHQGCLVHEEQLHNTNNGQDLHYFLRLAQSISHEALIAMRNIKSAISHDNDSWQITVTKEHLDNVVSELCDHKLQVLEFSRGRDFLEERFASLTTGKSDARSNA